MNGFIDLTILVVTQGFGSVQDTHVLSDFDMLEVEKLAQAAMVSADRNKISLLGDVAKQLAFLYEKALQENHTLERNAAIMQDREIDLATSELNDLTERVFASEAEVDELQNKVAAMHARETELVAENQKLAAQLIDQESLQDQVSALMESVQRMEGEKDILNQRLSDYSADLEEIATKRQQLNAAADSSETIVIELHDRVVQLEAELQVQQEELRAQEEECNNACEERDAAVNKYDRIANELVMLQEVAVPALNDVNGQQAERIATLEQYCDTTMV